MESFAYHNAMSVEEAALQLTKMKGKAKLYAGGTDLLDIMKKRILPGYPEMLINLKTIDGLDQVNVYDDHISIGALAKLSDIVKFPVVGDDYKMLADSIQSIASPNIRNMGTIGGNIAQDVRCWYYRYPEQIGGPIMCLRKGGKKCNALAGDNRYHSIFGAASRGSKKKPGKGGCLAVNPSDIATVLVTLSANIITNKRIINALDFFQADMHHSNVLKEDEIITNIDIPKPPDNATQNYIKFTLRKPVDFAIVNIASLVTIKDGCFSEIYITLGAVAPSPLRLFGVEEFLKGKPVDEGTINQAGDLAVKDAIPLSKNEYKIQIVKTLVKRSLLDAQKKLN